MSDPVLEAAQALAPLLAAGADGIAAEAKRQFGERAAGATRRVLEAVRGALGGKPPDEEAVASALRAQLDGGAISEGDLRETMRVLGVGGDNYGIQVNGKAYIGNQITVEEGGFHG